MTPRPGQDVAQVAEAFHHVGAVTGLVGELGDQVLAEPGGAPEGLLCLRGRQARESPQSPVGDGEPFAQIGRCRRPGRHALHQLGRTLVRFAPRARLAGIDQRKAQRAVGGGQLGPVLRLVREFLGDASSRAMARLRA